MLGVRHGEDYKEELSAISENTAKQGSVGKRRQIQLIADGGELTASLTHVSIASRNSRKRPSKK